MFKYLVCSSLLSMAIIGCGHPNETFIAQKGDKGDTGAQGLPGTDGLKGEAGERGEAGPKGPQGLPGLPGIQGPKGDTGLTGSQGLKGSTGDKGATGAQGLQGLTGPQGPKGDKGEPGTNGTTLVEYDLSKDHICFAIEGLYAMRDGNNIKLYADNYCKTKVGQLSGDYNFYTNKRLFMQDQLNLNILAVVKY